MAILQELRRWRDTQARTEGVETFRVFPNAVLQALSDTLPQNKEEMLCIKGLKEAKFRKYGSVLLKIIQERTGGDERMVNASDIEDNGYKISDARKKIGNKEKKGNLSIQEDQLSGINYPASDTLSVSQFLDGLNMELSGMASRVQGEVSSVDERERVVYFTIKDSKDESTLNCLIFRFQYDVSGVKIAIGDEIIVEGVPDIYKPSGRLSMKVGVIELSGVGALQKAYEALKLKFEQEGLFALERKRVLPAFPERIALITSEQGAAIGDFTMNLGAQGFHVTFFPTSVEGKKAVFEIMNAIKYFNTHPEKYDVLVIVRGGGSLESLQAFNNEVLVRAVAMSHIPTLLGVGHERDVTLAALVSDVMVSTPTATAKELRLHFDEARQLVRHFETHLPMLFSQNLTLIQKTLEDEGLHLLSYLEHFRTLVTTLHQDLKERLFLVQSTIERKKELLNQGRKSLYQGMTALLKQSEETLLHQSERLAQYDPMNVLKLGYSLVRQGIRVVKKSCDVKIGDILSVQLSRGKVTAKVEEIFE
ncbi:MAG: exodeoxyribonuclease VII large subunit [Candidatus Moranbacteria bacterium]|nr:exodeoxyribonuclease VII large subunit [Candidatus Moranbacteria bacterium]MDD3964688.1 exodeoxyribonuclease VII large subunit [Candidatus Moranbacteria bacterium]